MVQNIKDKSNEFASKTDENGAKGAKSAKEKGKRKKSHEPPLAACTIVNMIDGWKEGNKFSKVSFPLQAAVKNDLLTRIF